MGSFGDWLRVKGGDFRCEWVCELIFCSVDALVYWGMRI